MIHIHFKTCQSTQKMLKDHFFALKNRHPEEQTFLISAKEQRGGVGQKEKKWWHYKNSLAFSFSMKAEGEITLIPLEVGVLLVRFFREEYSLRLFLKWPNDLLNAAQEKVGGVLCTFLRADKRVIVGCGLNLFLERDEKKSLGGCFRPGSILDSPPLKKNFQEHLSACIAKFVCENRLPPNQVLALWERNSAHLNRWVKIGAQRPYREGIFSGIGPRGEGLIISHGQEMRCLNGPLSWSK